jgi:hypothetical protein
MSDIKNPDHEAENPAPMPQSHKKMAPRKEAAPGLEQDGEGNVIPLVQRTKEDQDKARNGR